MAIEYPGAFVWLRRRFVWLRGRASLVRRIPWLAIFVFGLLSLLLAGCGGKPFNVKTQVPLPVLTDAPLAESRGIRLQAAVVRDEDYLIETFDANLILADILPVSLTIANQSTQPLDLRKARFEVRGNEGRSYKAVEAKRAYKRLVSYYEISTYSKPAYRQSQEDFASYALDTAQPLAIGESRQGMLFFILPASVVQASGLKLVGARLDATQSRSAIELKLN